MTLSPTPRSTIGRHGERARSDRAELYSVLDAALICHLGTIRDGAPVVLPTCYGRDGDTLYLHGSTGAVSLRQAGGAAVCVTMTLLDGVVYARAAFTHSANYRSAVIHGQARQLSTETAKSHGLRVIVDHLAPGSWDYTRQPNRRELAATAVIAIDLAEASVKIRTGGPRDEPAEGVWGGVLPIRQVWGSPIPAADLSPGLDVPEHVRDRLMAG